MSNPSSQNLIIVEGAATYERILEAVRDDESEEGILYIKDFLKIYPEFAKAHNDLAVLYHRNGDSLKALAHYEKAHKLDPKNVTYRKNLADFYFVEIEWTGEAVHIYLDIVKENPLDTEALNALGTINMQLGRKKKALQFFTKTLQVDPLNQEAQLALKQLPPPSPGSIRITREIAVAQPVPPAPAYQKEMPVIPCTAAVEAKPAKTADELYREALQMAGKGETNEGIALLEQLLAQQPDHPLAHNDLGVLYQKSGNYANSRLHHEKAVKLQPTNSIFRKNLADLLYVGFGDMEAALGIYVELLAKAPQDIETLKAISSICQDIDNREDAKFFINKVLTLQPWDREAREALKALEDADSGRAL